MQAALSFRGFDFTSDKGTICHVDEVGEEVRGWKPMAVTWTARRYVVLGRWGYVFKCAESVGVRNSLRKWWRKVSLRGRQKSMMRKSFCVVQHHKSWKTQLPATHKA